MFNDMTRGNQLTTKHTAFTSLLDMMDAKGSYRPSMDVREPEIKELADIYDAAQEARGDDRRAFRYGVDKTSSVTNRQNFFFVVGGEQNA